MGPTKDSPSEDELVRVPLAFLSYSRADTTRALAAASLVRKAGFRVWIDSSDIRVGSEFAKSITQAIEKADIFVVCLSPSSADSPWVTRELDHALHLYETRGRPRPFPIKIARTDVPLALERFHYFDASESFGSLEKELRAAAREFRPRVAYKRASAKTSPRQESTAYAEAFYRVPASKRVRRLILAAIGIEIQQVTNKHFGGLSNVISEADVKGEQIQIQKSLISRARGILANFVQAGAITETGGLVLVRNGEIQPRVEEVVGPIPGSLCLKTSITCRLINPDKRRVVKSLPTEINGLGVDFVEYTFRLDPTLQDLGARVVDYFRNNGLLVSQSTPLVVGETAEGCRISIEWAPESLDIRLPASCLPALQVIPLAETVTGYEYA